MSLGDWLAAGADPAKMTMEEVRRHQNLCAVREEQAAARLEALLAERDAIFRKGAQTRSAPLRRVLARRWSRLDGDVRTQERDLARTGKEVAGLAALRQLLRDGVPLVAPGDCTPLLQHLDDPTAAEEDFAARLAVLVTGSRGEPRTGPVRIDQGGVIGVWDRMDRGEVKDPDEALRKLDGR
jgi:hypothetical protein